MDKFKALDPTLMYFLGFKEKEDDYEIQDEKTGRINKGHYHNFIISIAEPFAQNENHVSALWVLNATFTRSRRKIFLPFSAFSRAISTR